MKYIITATVTILFIAACTHGNHRTRTEKIEDNNKTVKIEDDGNLMRIKAEISNTAEPVDYNKSFDVRGMNEKQIDKLKNHILDSLYKIK